MSYSYRPVMEPTRFPAAGSCIYCGATDGLSDEHIIPFGLGGNLILPDSSCPRCSAITSTFERSVLRGFMLPGRTVATLPTRRPKDRPTTFDLQVVKGGREETVTLPAARFPALLHLPVFETAAFISGAQRKPGITVHARETISFGTSPLDTLKSLAAKAIRRTDTIDVFAFARMLAKIGYSYAAALRGTMDLGEVCVLPLISGDSDDARTWVGSAHFDTLGETHGALHSLALVTVDTQQGPLLLSRIKLFASSGASGYEVVVRTPPAA